MFLPEISLHLQRRRSFQSQRQDWLLVRGREESARGPRFLDSRAGGAETSARRKGDGPPAGAQQGTSRDQAVFAFFLRCAHLCFASSERRLRVAALIWRGERAFFFRSAHIAFAASEMPPRPLALMRWRRCFCFIAVRAPRTFRAFGTEGRSHPVTRGQ